MVVRGLPSAVLIVLACGNVPASPLYEALVDDGSTGVVSTRSILSAGRASRLLKGERREEDPVAFDLATAAPDEAERRALAEPLSLTEFMDASSTNPTALVDDDLCTDAALVAFCRERGLGGTLALSQTATSAVLVDPEATLAYPGQGQLSTASNASTSAVNPYPGPGVVAQPSGAEADPLYSQEPLVKEWAKRHGLLSWRDFLMENRYRLILALFGVYLVAITFNMLVRSFSAGGGPSSGGRASRRRRRR